MATCWIGWRFGCKNFLPVTSNGFLRATEKEIMRGKKANMAVLLEGFKYNRVLAARPSANQFLKWICPLILSAALLYGQGPEKR